MNKKLNTNWVPLFFLVLIISASCQQKKASTPEFSFKHHFIHSNLPTGWVNGVQSLADYDNDGDLDMTVGSKPRGLFLFVNNDTIWETVKIGDVPYTSLGAATIDVDQDGWIDLVSTGVWYRNEGNYTFTIYEYDPEFEAQKENSRRHFHDLVAVDINEDGKPDITRVPGLVRASL